MSDATRLHVQAEQCFRLARGPASLRLAGELEALGRAFEQEAREVELRAEHHPEMNICLIAAVTARVKMDQ